MELENVDGIPIFSWWSKESFKMALAYEPKDDDIFVAGYPKSGTTWTQYIVHQILNGCTEIPFINEMMSDYGPKVHPGTLATDKNDGIKRHMKTHFPFEKVPYNEKAKYIYIIRNPWDACVSSFNYLTGFPPDARYNGSFDNFFNDYIDGKVMFGSYFNHATSWLNQRGKKNILFLTFEETKRNTKETILKVAQFLGDQYYTELIGNNEKMEILLKQTSFDYMKHIPFVVPSTKETFKKTGLKVGRNIGLVNSGEFENMEFCRSGQVAYTQHWYSEQQKCVMKEMIRTHLSKFQELIELWKKFEIDM